MLTESQWNLIREATYAILLGMDNQLNLPQNVFLPKNRNNLSDQIDALQFEADLDQTLQITSDALKEVSSKMAEIHDVAATITVNAPSDEDIDKLKKDLNKISDDLKNDQRFKTVVALASATANIIGQLRGNG